VYTIGVGTPNATTVQVGSAMLRARLDEETLKEIARVTDAKYYNASNEQDLRAVYEKLTTQLVTRLQPQDISFLFTAAAFFFGALAMMLSVVWSNRLP
jgi:Ca-activated chloride channel family protein